MKLNFLKEIIGNFAPQVFTPVPTGILYTFLQAISREISGECSFDTGEECYKGFNSYWYLKCRNNLCPGYRNPTGLIAYTSRSDTTTSVDNRFDYSSIRYLSGIGSDFVLVGTLGAQIKWDFGLVSDLGGFGAFGFGAGFFGFNGYSGAGSNVVIGDSWTISCQASNGIVNTPIPAPENKGYYSAVTSGGIYTGKLDTTYTVQIIDFWGYVQNFQDAILQISLSDCTDVWLDYWGAYFGLPRLLLTNGYEDDETYRARIMKEITEAKGTKPVLLAEAQNYFGSDLVTITEYHQIVQGSGMPLWDGPVTDQSDPAYGLWPWEFYINLPTQKSPSSKFVKTGANLTEAANYVYVYEAGHSGSYYSYGQFGHINSGSSLFPLPTSVGDSTLYGCATKFSGVNLTFTTPGVGGVYVWEYWNGSSWIQFIAGSTYSETTGGLTANGGEFWLVPNDWKTVDNIPYNIPNIGTKLYWVRCRVVTPPSITPIINTMTILHVGSTDSGVYIGHGTDVGGSYDPTKRDNNNIYIYLEISFAKPIWQTGLQDLIDRLKTAGTICIVNPID